MDDQEQASICQKFQNLPSEFQTQTIVKIIKSSTFTVDQLKKLKHHVSHKLNTTTIRVDAESASKQNFVNLLTTMSDFEKLNGTYTMPMIISLLPTLTNVQVTEIHVAIYYELKRTNPGSSCSIC